MVGNNWVKDLEADVKTECDKKYGKVVHIAVDPNTDGDIYVKFDSVTSGEKATSGSQWSPFQQSRHPCLIRCRQDIQFPLGSCGQQILSEW